MIFKIEQLHWLEGSTPQSDYCIHGRVTLKVGNTVFSQDDEDFTLSTTGLFLLRMVNHDYPENCWWGNQLLPCCGHTFCPNDNVYDLKKGFIALNLGCPNGYDFLVFHNKSKVTIRCKEETEEISDTEWKLIVLDFTDRIEEEYSKCAKDKIEDEYERRGYRLFWEEWNNRKEELRRNLTYIGITQLNFHPEGV